MRLITKSDREVLTNEATEIIEEVLQEIFELREESERLRGKALKRDIRVDMSFATHHGQAAIEAIEQFVSVLRDIERKSK